MNRIFLSLVFLILSFFLTSPVIAKSENFISVVNPVRGADFWDQKNQQPQDAVKGQVEILKQFNIQASWLIRSDALSDEKILSILPNQDEKGLFLEVIPSWSKETSLEYHKSQSWHSASSAFLTGYELNEREKLIDSAFDKFKKVYGVYPKSVGAWWIDSYSLSYMQKKYNITSALIVADQYSTDNYQIWGQYFSTPYYPSKNNALHPAQNLENKLPIVITQWASRDPVNAYGNGVFESTFSLQANDYLDYHNLDTKYFSKLVDIYTNQPFNKFSHLVVGLENSYSWEKYKSEYQNQIKTLVEKRNTGQISLLTLKDFSNWYIARFPNISPEQIIIADDSLGSQKKVVWFMNPFYRAGWFYSREISMFRDIRQYVDGEEELCFKQRCETVNFATSAIRVLDDVSFGHKWVIDEGRISDFKVNKNNENFVISYKNEVGRSRNIEFLPRDISIDEKISSIDTSILEATKKDISQKPRNTNIAKNSLNWSLRSVFSETLKFILFLTFACLIPGLVISRKRNLFVSVTVGIVSLTLCFYIASLLRFKLLVPVYLVTGLILFFKLRYFKELKLPNFKKRNNLIFLGVIIIGTVFQTLPTFRSGLTYPYGLGLWGPNTHDGVWHIALINQLVKAVPPENPIFSGVSVKNYHFFYDILIACTNYLTQLSITDLVFRFYPILFSMLLGIGTYYLMTNIYKKTLAMILSLYLIYFAGSFGWIVEYIKVRHLGGESAFWANQSISFNLNPPFAISLIIVIAIFYLLSFDRVQKSFVPLVILCGVLLPFKAYAAVLILTTLLIISIIRRSIQIGAVFITSVISSYLFFISNFSLGDKLILFSPFWFIHSMIDSPDRVGWVRVSLMRNTGFEKGNWLKVILAELISLTIFILGNLGTRLFALPALLGFKYIVRREILLSISIFSLLSFVIPILFIQAGNPWNTIQFLYYGLYSLALIAGTVLSNFLTKFNNFFAKVFILMILIITPINSWATANGYLSYQPHALISSQEIEALEFLSKQKDGIVLIYPYDPKLKTKITEPWPLYAYDSTAYVSALSKKPSYLEDEGQNQILLTDYKKRLVASKDFFLSTNSESRDFILNNHISYIYIPKVNSIRLDQETLGVNNIFENDEVIVYGVKNR